MKTLLSILECMLFSIMVFVLFVLYLVATPNQFSAERDYYVMEMEKKKNM